MHLNHLGLPVRGPQRSQQFYSAYFGFDSAGARGCAGAAAASAETAAELLGSRAGRQPPGVTLRAQRLTFAALAPDPGQPAPVAAWQAVIQAWLAGLVAARQPRDPAGLFICVKAAACAARHCRQAQRRRGEAAAAACSPA